jgi:ORF6N domain
MTTQLVEKFAAQPLVYRGNRVITLSMMDTSHGRPPGTAGRNFRQNRCRLTQDEDYYEVSQPDEIRRLGCAREDGNTPEKIILLAESGYLLLVKSFRDDLAWEVQRALVNIYFRAKDAVPLIENHAVALVDRLSVIMGRFHGLLSLGGLEKRDEILLKDVTRGWMLTISPAHGREHLPGLIPVSAIDRAMDLGYGRVKRGEDTKLGKAVAAAYREANGGEEPLKHTQFIDGRPVKVCSYFDSDFPVIDHAIRKFFADQDSQAAM